MLTIVYLIAFLIIAVAVAISLIFAFNSSKSGLKASTIRPPSIEMKVSDSAMDPIIFLGVLSSIITITGAIRDAGAPVTSGSIRARYFARAETPGTREAKLDARPHLIERAIKTVTSIGDRDKKFLDRIQETCLKKHDEAIDNYDLSSSDMRQAYEQARFCVCENLRVVQDRHRGIIPPEFKELYDEYKCALL
jgi:hypothetical protein